MITNELKGTSIYIYKGEKYSNLMQILRKIK